MNTMDTNENGDAVDENDTNENSAVANVLRTGERQQEQKGFKITIYSVRVKI